MTEITVVNMRNCNDWGKSGDVKIDRTTIWGNPFKMTSELQREAVCMNYELYFMNMIEFRNGVSIANATINALHRLGLTAGTATYCVKAIAPQFDIANLVEAKRLGCWCAPKQCHGDFLKKMVDVINTTNTEKNIV